MAEYVNRKTLESIILDCSPEVKILLNNVPDIVSIVRCKECEYRGDHNCPMFHLVPSGEYIDFARDEGFCHRGYSKKQLKPMKFNWRHPVQEQDGMWIPDKEDWPSKCAYHILQVKARNNDKLYAYNDGDYIMADGDYIVAKYNSMLECWETAGGMDYIHWAEVKRWAVLTDNNGCPLTNMEDDD